MDELAEYEKELTDLFNEINENLRQLSTLKNSYTRETKQDYIANRIRRCQNVITGYKTELRFIGKNKDQIYQQKIIKFEHQLDQLCVNFETKRYKDNDITSSTPTDKILDRAVQIQKEDKNLLANMLKLINSIKS